MNLGDATGAGVEKSQTRERRGTDDHGSNDRAVLTGEQTAAIEVSARRLTQNPAWRR